MPWLAESEPRPDSCSSWPVTPSGLMASGPSAGSRCACKHSGPSPWPGTGWRSSPGTRAQGMRRRHPICATSASSLGRSRTARRRRTCATSWSGFGQRSPRRCPSCRWTWRTTTAWRGGRSRRSRLTQSLTTPPLMGTVFSGLRRQLWQLDDRQGFLASCRMAPSAIHPLFLPRLGP